MKLIKRWTNIKNYYKKLDKNYKTKKIKIKCRKARSSDIRFLY